MTLIFHTANFLLGVWVFLTPWTMGLTKLFGAKTYIGWNFWIFGAAIMITSALALLKLRPWKEKLTFCLGVLLLISPWVLGYMEVYYLFWNAIFPAFAIIIGSALALEVAMRPQPRKRVQLYLIHSS
jgi:hypothetical protein